MRQPMVADEVPEFAGKNTTVLFLDDGTEDAGDSQLESLAHGVIALEKSTPEYGSVKRRLEVHKLRGIDFVTGKHDFVVKRGGLDIFPRLIASELQEDYPAEAILNNVMGTRLVAQMAQAFGAHSVVLISTDQAVNPA